MADKKESRGSYQPPTVRRRSPVTKAQLRSPLTRQRFHDAGVRSKGRADRLTAEWTATPPSIPRPRRRVGEAAKPKVQDAAPTETMKRGERPFRTRQGHTSTEAERRAHREAGGERNLSSPKSMTARKQAQRARSRAAARVARAEKRRAGTIPPRRGPGSRAPGRR